MTTLAHADERLTALTRRRYNRIASVYDAMESVMELGARKWRRELWARVRPGRVLELGVGTGKNIALHPPGREVVAIDISERMLDRARSRAKRLDVRIHLELGDAQALPYADNSFDAVVATFLLCSVPDPRLSVAEALRVLKPGGQLLLLEHVLSERRPMRRLMQWLDPIPFHLWGAHINRDTLATVRGGGFLEVTDTNLWGDVVKRIEARAPEGKCERSVA